MGSISTLIFTSELILCFTIYYLTDHLQTLYEVISLEGVVLYELNLIHFQVPVRKSAQ